MMRRTAPRKATAARESELLIDSLSNTGDGVGRIDERVVFVAHTMPGDQVRIRIVKDKRTFLQGQLVELLDPAAERIDPLCEYFTQCGGCDWQHIPYQLQLNTKTAHVIDTLRRIGGLENVEVLPIIPSDTAFHYRNRVQGLVQDGRFHMRRKASHATVAVDACQIADERINEAIKNRLDSVAAGKVEIAVVDEQAEIIPLADLHATGLGFRQINSLVSDRLSELVLGIITDSQCTHVYDFYCGRGEWTNRIGHSSPGAQVTGVDSEQVNINAAQAAAQQSGLQNVRYLCARVEDCLSMISAKAGVKAGAGAVVQKSICIVDPPRAGLDSSVTQALCKKRMHSLIYVSCHPATLARDLKILTQKAYTVKSVQPLDMFPQTAHVECLVHLEMLH